MAVDMECKLLKLFIALILCKKTDCKSKEVKTAPIHDTKVCQESCSKEGT